MPVAEKMLQKKVNIKFTSKSSRGFSEREAQESEPCLTKKSNLKVKWKLSGLSNKRKSELILDVLEEKRRKMDGIVKRHCSIILKELLSHRFAWIFDKPVDPVVLGLPDYFSIISDPMDLGTIKSKLEDNLYFSSEEFAADVCLTFSNAMLYNPPDNPTHQFARELDHHFKKRWKFQLASWTHQNEGAGLIHNVSGFNAQNGGDVLSKKLKADISLGAKNSTPIEEKHGLRKEVMVILRSLKSTEKLQKLLQRFNVKDGELGPNVNALGVSSLKELKRELKGLSDSNYANSVPAKRKANGLNSLSGKVLCKGACSVINNKQSVSSSSPLCGLCRGGADQCCHQKNKVPTSSNVLEKSLKEVNHTTNTKSRDSERKVSLTHGSVSDQDSDGPGSVLDEDNTLTSCGLSVPFASGGSNEGCDPLMDDQSLKKALRAAMLKSRFADTIMKASGNKADPIKMHQERERLERLQREEAAKIEAQRKEEELKLKMMLEKERQAARIALEKMERTVELEDNLKGLRELEILSQCSASDFILAFGVSIDKRTSQFRRPLELIGLHLKEDDVNEGELGLSGEREEGEIIQ